MRVAALYDIHGNHPALEAVLQEVRRANVARIVIGGDVLPGPLPREALDCLMSLELPVQLIRGNGDREVLALRSGKDPASVPEHLRAVVSWTAQELRPEHDRFLADLPETLPMEIPGLGQVLFCHATPRSDTELFTRLTPEDRVLPALEGVDASVVVCGHTHMQFDRMVSSTRVVNAGSVGMPFGAPGADWLLLGPEVEFRHTLYDLEQAAELIRASAYPKATEFADRNVLQPPSEEQMLRLFAKLVMR